jgi:Tol biopolymer transport system component
VAFRWLPDGERLLLCTASPDGEGLRWVLLDLQGEAHPVGPAFTPAQECFIALHFFEQVGISHPFLSADGKHVIFAGHCAEAVPGVPEGEGPDSHVFVTDLGSGSTVSVGRGRFACLF